MQPTGELLPMQLIFHGKSEAEMKLKGFHKWAMKAHKHCKDNLKEASVEGYKRAGTMAALTDITYSLYASSHIKDLFGCQVGQLPKDEPIPEGVHNTQFAQQQLWMITWIMTWQFHRNSRIRGSDFCSQGGDSRA